MGTDLGRVIKEYFETMKLEEKVYCSLYTISELFYVLCRLKGLGYAVEKMNMMLSSRVVEINNTVEMALEAGRLKCERAISIGDCSCIATAKITRSQAIFAKKEKEIATEMKTKPFDVEILFLTELNNRRDKE
ncbi:MAG: PIN domain-containing protein, partial [Candidatus Freyarchaeota archaeon]